MYLMPLNCVPLKIGKLINFVFMLPLEKEEEEEWEGEGKEKRKRKKKKRSGSSNPRIQLLDGTAALAALQ